LQLGLKSLPLGRSLLLKFGDHHLKTRFRTIDLSLEDVRSLLHVTTDDSHSDCIVTLGANERRAARKG